MSTPEWTINGVPASAFESVIITLADQSAGTLQLTRAAAAEAPAPFAAGDAISVADPAGRVRFTGTVRQPRDVTETGTQQRQITAGNDAWGRLERTVLMADYPFDDSDRKDCRVILAGKLVEVDISDPDARPRVPVNVLDLVPVDCAATVREALAYAGFSDLRQAVQVGGIIPPQQADGISCAGAIQAVCKYFPGAVAWVDPATGTANVRPASVMDPFTLDLRPVPGREVVSYRVTERPELRIPGVRLCVRKVRDGGAGGQVETLTIYQAGNPDAEGGITRGVTLSPETHALDIALLEIIPLGTEPANDLAFWGERIPWVKTAATTYPNFKLYGGRLEIEPENGVITRLPNVILRGDVPESFRLRGCSGPYDPLAPIVESDNGRRPRFVHATLKATVNYSDPDTRLYGEHPISIPLLLTDLPVGTKRWASEDPLGYDPGEDATTFADLPARFLRETQRLGYSVELQMSCDELPAAPMGRALCLDGGRSEWLAMNAPIHEVTLDIKGRCLNLRAGAAPYLNLNDQIDMLVAINHRRPPRRRSTKAGLPPNYSDPAAGNNPPPEPPPTGPGQPAPPTPAEHGTITFNLSPQEAIDDGAEWFAVSDAGASFGPNQSGISTPVAPGTYTVYCAAVSGWRRPPAIRRVQIGIGTAKTFGDDQGRYTPVSVSTMPFAPILIAPDSPAGPYKLKIGEGSLALDDYRLPAVVLNRDNTSVLTAPIKVWIEAKFEGTLRDLPVLVTMKQGADWWPEYPSPFKLDGEGLQDMLYLPVCEVNELPADDLPVVRALLTSNQVLAYALVGGRFLRVWRDAPGLSISAA